MSFERSLKRGDTLDELNKILSELQDDKGLETSTYNHGSLSSQFVDFVIREILRLRKETTELEQRVKTLEES